MTIQAATARVSFPCNGVSNVFPVNIQAYLATDFLVLLTNASGSTTLTLNSDYTLVASGSLSPPFWSLTTQTGQLVSPYVTGNTLQVILNPSETQLTQYTQGQAFPSLAVQTNLDRLTQMVIREGDQLSRAITAPDGDVSPNMLLPSTALRASKNLGFDPSGNLAVNLALASGTISTATLAPFLGLSQTAAELAAGVTPIQLFYPPGNLLRYGVNTTPGVTDMSGALNNALAALGPIGGQVTIPAGLFLMHSAVTYTFTAALSSILLQGTGVDSTELRWNIASGGTGWIFNFPQNTVHIRDILFTTTIAGGGTAILTFLNTAFSSKTALNDISDCTFRGSDGYDLTNYWSNCIVQNETAGFNIVNCDFVGSQPGGANTVCNGNGVVLEGVNGTPGILTNITDCLFQYLNKAVNYSTFYQGLSISETNFTINNYGIYQGSNQASDAQLAIMGSQFDCDYAIVLLSGIEGVLINANYFISRYGPNWLGGGNNDQAIIINGDFNFTITGNYFVEFSGTPIPATAISIGTVPVTFTGAPSSGATSATLSASWALNGSRLWNVTFNTGEVRPIFIPSGGTATSWFIPLTSNETVNAVGCAGVGVISANTFSGYQTGIALALGVNGVNIFNNAIDFNEATSSSGGQTFIANSSTGINTIANNPGFNPVGALPGPTITTSPQVIINGASPATYYFAQSATNTATLSHGGILTVGSPSGSGTTGVYKGIPLLDQSAGGKGSGAIGTVTVTAGAIASCVITNSGTGYQVGASLNVSVPGGGGFFAVATVSPSFATLLTGLTVPVDLGPNEAVVVTYTATIPTVSVFGH